MTLLARRKLRLLALEALRTETGIDPESPGSWVDTPSKLPSLRVRALRDRKASVARTMPEFTTVIGLEVMVTVMADTKEAVQDALEALCGVVEEAIFGNAAIVAMCQQFSTAQSDSEIVTEGEKPIARAVMSFDCETFEAFDVAQLNPADTPDLKQFGIHVDLKNRFDATGTYADLPFPAAVPGAPRTTGPDGRDEGGLLIDIPT